MIARCVPFSLLALTALFASCKKNEIQTYRVSKETPAPAAPATPPPTTGANAAPPSATPPPPMARGTSMADTAVATTDGPGLKWTAPPTWKPKAGSAMRKGSFAIAGEGGEGDLAITAFPGDVGGDLANLNRWRSQINLPPVSQTEFETSVQRQERNGLRMILVDIVGKEGNAQRILGAMIPHGGSTWFVKLTGPDALVAKEKAAFMSFLDTIQAPAVAK